jgi:FkbM family methyltransferase
MIRWLRRLPKLYRLLRNREYRRGLRHGVPAAIEHETLLRALPIRTLLDVGANNGQFSLVASVSRPNLVIHAFEPLAESADKFERLFASSPDVVLHRVAAGDVDGEADIHISNRPDSSSLLPISALQSCSFVGTEEVSVRTIPVRKLDSILSGTDLPMPLMVKLDVQGYELAALKGMSRLLDRATYIYAELSFVPLYEGQPLASEVISWLSEHGFEFSDVQTIGRLPSGVGAQADVLFSRTGSPHPANMQTSVR